MESKKFLIRLLLLIFFIFLLDYLAMQFYWYSSIWYLDMLIHFLGGLWLGLALVWLFRIKEISFKSIFYLILGVLLIGVLWEIFEIIIDETITGNSFNTLDTISDIFFDIAGGSLALLYFFKKLCLLKKILYN